MIADLMRQGHDIAIPFGHNQPYDLIVIWKEDGRLEKVQVKYATGDGRVVRAVVRSSSAWVRHRYTRNEVDWTIYEATSSSCFYVTAYVWDGYSELILRLRPTLNGQTKGVRWAEDFSTLRGDAQGGPVSRTPLPFEHSPE